MNPIVLIPARMAATRLPGKPLAVIGDRPMLAHVIARAREAAIGRVVVAAADAEIAVAAVAAGAEALLTDPALPSGSDRVHAALDQIDPGNVHDVVVNLQGDFPTVAGSVLRACLLPLADPTVDIGTVVMPIVSEEERMATSVVKVAVGFAPGARLARALYFSRLAVPANAGPHYHHLGIYAYRRAALARFVSWPPSVLEQREGLEQLRALDAGLAIGCALVPAGAFGVDTPDDLARARALLA